jgi:hypothetical protein
MTVAAIRAITTTRKPHPNSRSRARPREVAPTATELARARRWWIEESGLSLVEIAEIARLMWTKAD